MAMGPGKYEEECTLVRERTNARACMVIILEGNKGNGFSVQLADDPSQARFLPEILETVAQSIRRDLERFNPERQ